jgi:uncharacterized RDD family membrane protein YckC
VHVVGPPAAPPRYTGLVTRVIAFAIDAALINLVAFVVGAVIALCLSALPVGGDTEKVVAAISGVVYLVWWGAYFVSFWSTTGQTPGAHVMRFRVHDRASGGIPGLRRSLVRLAGLVLAAIPLCAGFVPILFDAKRRGLQDFLAHTVVTDTDDEVAPVTRSRRRAAA